MKKRLPIIIHASIGIVSIFLVILLTILSFFVEAIGSNLLLSSVAAANLVVGISNITIAIEKARE